MASEGENEASDVAGAKTADDGGASADEPAAPSSDSSSGRKTPLDDLSDAIVEARTLPRMEPPRRVSGPPPLPRRPAPPPRPSRLSLPLPPALPHTREVDRGASFSSSIPPQVLEAQPVGVEPVPEIRAPEWRHASAPPAEEPTLRLPVKGPHRWGVAAFAAILGIGAGAVVAAAFDIPRRSSPAQTAVTMPNVARNPSAPGAHEPEVTPVADVRGVQPALEDVTKQAKRDWAAKAGQAPVVPSASPPAAAPEAAAVAAPAPESPAAAPPADAAPAGVEAPADPNMGFNRGAASAAIGGAADVAASCRQPEDRPGRAQVSLTFAPSGRVTQVIVSGDKYAGTPTGSCIARAFKGLSVPPFTGDAVTVTKAVRVR